MRSWRCYIKVYILFPFVGETLGSAVVTSQSVNSRFDQNEPILGVFVLSALLQMPSDVYCLLDQTVDILGNLRSAT